MFPSEELDAPTGGAIPALEDSSADENAGETGDPMLDNPFAIGVKEERRRQRIAYEMQLNKLERTGESTSELLSDKDIAKQEEEHVLETLGTAKAQAALINPDHNQNELKALSQMDIKDERPQGKKTSDDVDVDEFISEIRVDGAAYRSPIEIIDEFLQQLHIIFERAPKGHLVTSPELERKNAVIEALEQSESGTTHAVAKGETISIGERAIRLLTTCCTLMGDRRWGDKLAERAKRQLLEVLTATEEHEELVISQALSVLVPPILQTHCKDWVQFSNFQTLCVLVKMNPLVGMQLTPLAQTLKTVIVAEEGTAAQPLFTLIGLLANYEERFPRIKCGGERHRPDSHFSGSPARALHDVGMTTAVANWLCGSTSTMKTWTLHRQFCTWQMAEGLARYVRPAAVKLVDAGVADAVKTELLKECRGQLVTIWSKEKGTFVTQLVKCTEALSKHVNEARAKLFLLPSRFGSVLGPVNEKWTQVYEEEQGKCPLIVVLPLLLEMPARADAALLAALLNLVASLVASANGAMLAALSEILWSDPKRKLLDLARSRAEAGYLDDIIRNASLGKPEPDENAVYNPEPLASDDPDVIMMLKQLVFVISTYATRAEEWRKATSLANLGQGPPPEAKAELALTVTNAFDEDNRDQLLFRLLKKSRNEDLKIAAMECLSKVPVAAFERSEVDELVGFVIEKVKLHEVYVGRNEELMMHAFNCFARIVRVPDDDNGRRSAGTFFRRDYGNLVQIAMQLLRQNSAREIPQSAGDEREQKGKLSQALTYFLQSCSGPAEGREHEQDPPPVWPQAVSVMQMREMTQSMLEVMQNEEAFGDDNYTLSLEQSALADKIDALLFTLPSISIKSSIKARLLNRLAELLEGDAADDASPFQLDADGDGVPDGDTEVAKKLRQKRFQHHVTFHRKGGVDLVLTQLENEMSELRQEVANAAESRFVDVDGDGTGDRPIDVEQQDTEEIIPREAQPEVVKSKVAHVLKFVEMEAMRSEVALTYAGGDDDIDVKNMTEGAVKEFVDWHVYGEAALYSEDLHLMEDIGQGNQMQDKPLVSASVMAEAKKSEAELAEEEALRTIWAHAEQSVAATLRILTACVKYGSAATIEVFLERMARSSTQNDVLLIAGHVGVFTTQSESNAAARFVEFFRELLAKESQDSLVDTSMLPLLDVLGRLLPRLLKPHAARMVKALDIWASARHASKADREQANEELLRSQSTDDSNLLKSVEALAGLYATMLSALTEMEFSLTNEEVDVGAKELAMRRLLPPIISQVSSHVKTAEIDDNAVVAFLSMLFYDKVLCMAEGWEPSEYTSKDNDSLARQKAIGAIKGVFASFLLIDEERRFELFQLTARLEARWGIQLSAAVMHAITDLTEHALYKRAIEPYMLRRNFLEPEGERILEATWMVQELPKQKPSTLLVVTNRALYLLSTPAVSGICAQCESWKLCPDGPKLNKRVALYKITRVVIDFTAAYGAGHRIRIEYSTPDGSIEDGNVDMSMISSAFSGCQTCTSGIAAKAKAVKWNPFGPKGLAGTGAQRPKPGDADHEQSDAQTSEPGAVSLTGRTPGEVPASTGVRQRGGKKMALQFSSLLVGVVQKIALAIQAASAQPPSIVLDSFATRAIELQRAQKLQKSKGKLRAATNVNVFVVPFHCELAMKVEMSMLNTEDLADNGSTPKEVLLIVTTDSLLFYSEKASLFAVPPLLDSSNVRNASMGLKGDGIEALKELTKVNLEDITSIELEMSAEPRARLAIEGSKTLLLVFADDTGAMLWRYQMRNVLWGAGKSWSKTWTGKSLGGPGGGGGRQKSSRNDRGAKGLGI